MYMCKKQHDIVQQFIVYYARTQNKLLERPLNSFLNDLYFETLFLA